jgi:hypothetical protein
LSDGGTASNVTRRSSPASRGVVVAGGEHCEIGGDWLMKRHVAIFPSSTRTFTSFPASSTIFTSVVPFSGASSISIANEMWKGRSWTSCMRRSR